MDLTDLQRMSHLIEGAPPARRPGPYSPSRPELWQVVEATGSGTVIVADVFDGGPAGRLRRTVRSTPGQQPRVGDVGILVGRGDGELCFFEERGHRFVRASGPVSVCEAGVPDPAFFGQEYRRGVYGWELTRSGVPVWKFAEPIVRPRGTPTVFICDGVGLLSWHVTLPETLPPYIYSHDLTIEMTLRCIHEDFDPAALGYGGLLSLRQTIDGPRVQARCGGAVAPAKQFGWLSEMPLVLTATVSRDLYGFAIETTMAGGAVSLADGATADVRLRVDSVWCGPILF